MKQMLITHRGNINGPNPQSENHPDYIDDALWNGYDVEIDVRYLNNKFYLGHDNPQYEISRNFFYNDKLWIHCKNVEALYELISNPAANVFGHNNDDFVLTNHNYIWTMIGKQLTDKSIAVMPELADENYDVSIAAGICTDYPLRFKK